ncbi:Aldo/keto reductase [Venturia nashicola]|uniref:Aldo/keto reductase n=1 Tax=Venturia nashicola TaxID=86259 RepID=A0A4Z1NYS4_9PEZI|nr:Aldo/keto reductase [Venturia nashicola]
MPPTMKNTSLGSTGLRVSPICVGCMSFRDLRGRHSWATDCSNGTSEIILGKAIKEFRWRRSNLVIATKLFLPVGREPESDALYTSIEDREAGGYINEFGLSRKHIFDAVDASLKRLDLEYIDLLQIHRFDPTTSTKETMEALHDVVKSAKVRYIGASSMWAHQLLEYQYTARLHRWTEIFSMQNLHNPTYREEEHEIVPSLKKFGMGMIPWFSVAMGFLTRPHAKVLDSERGASMKGSFMGQVWTDMDKKINEKIEEIAKNRGVSMAIASIAWSLEQTLHDKSDYWNE